VTAVFSTQTHQIEVEDAALAVLRFASGALGTVVTSTAVFPGFAQRLEISGTDGTVVIEDGEIIRCELSADGAEPGRPGRGTDDASTPSAAAANPADLAIASHAAQLSDLLDAIDEGRAPSVTAQDGRAVLEVVCAIYESARDGRTVRLPPAAGSDDTRRAPS
jgi:UDP-N-acetyl-2-amino-2-deoxyglucuronate dehydrogenase